jgi:transcriptional regulator with XRE-family HTH domain
LKDILAEITRLRLNRNWSEYQLAQHSGISQSTISTWYRKNQVPTIQTLEKVCLGFGITLSQFFANDDDAVSLTESQKELLDCWAALTETQQALFMQLFKNI